MSKIPLSFSIKKTATGTKENINKLDWKKALDINYSIHYIHCASTYFPYCNIGTYYIAECKNNFAQWWASDCLEIIRPQQEYEWYALARFNLAWTLTWAKSQSREWLYSSLKGRSHQNWNIIWWFTKLNVCWWFTNFSFTWFMKFQLSVYCTSNTMLQSLQIF